MAIPAGVEHVVFGGSLPDGEVWQSGYWARDNLPSDEAGASAEADLALGAMLSTDPSGGLRITMLAIASVTTTVEYARVYVYHTGGPHADFVGEHVLATPFTGGATIQHNPNQCALVVTTRTDFVGRSRRGRMYLPATGAPLSATGQLDDTRTGNIATGWATYFHDQTANPSGTHPCVVSRTHTYSAPITAISVDSRIDIQRRRANRETIDFRHTVAA